MEDRVKHLRKSTRDLSRARKKADEAWESHIRVIQDAHRDGMSCAAIGRITGVSKARIWQIVRREDTRKDDATGDMGRREAGEENEPHNEE